tara:strand:+ start:694 stop:1404 length:711 start_codon:yes stop_codon:yes gene_type:complete
LQNLPDLLLKIDDFNVIRGDKISGGLKQFALEQWLPEQPFDHFIYCGTVFGYGAPALAYAGKECGKKITIFLSQSKFTPHWLNDISDISNVVVKSPSSLDMLHQDAVELQKNLNGTSVILTPGSYGNGFNTKMAQVCKALVDGKHYQRMWVPVVSGTMLKVIESCFPSSEVIPVYCTKRPDYISSTSKLRFQCHKKYHQTADVLPPYPSSHHVDAKMWSFIQEYGQKGDLVWNIAK